MSRAKDILLAGLTLCAGGLAIVAWRQHVALRDLTEALRATHASLAPPAKTLTVRPAAKRTFGITPRAPQAAIGVAPQPDYASGDDLPFAERPAKAPGLSARRGSALVRLMENPEFVQALSLQRHAMLDARFGELFRRLNLPGEELTAFKRLLAEKENVALDVVTVSESSPENSLSPELLRASIRAAQGQIEQAIHSSLGSDRYSVYREYERTLPHRATVAQLEQRLSYTNVPLTPTQAEAVVRIMASNTPPDGAEAPPSTAVVVRAGVPEAVPILPTSTTTGRVTDDVVSQVQGVLAPAQVEALREIQMEQQAAVKAAQMIQEVAPPVTEVLPTWPALMLN